MIHDVKPLNVPHAAERSGRSSTYRYDNSVLIKYACSVLCRPLGTLDSLIVFALCARRANKGICTQCKKETLKLLWVLANVPVTADQQIYCSSKQQSYLTLSQHKYINIFVFTY